MRDSFLQKGNSCEECSPFIIAHSFAQEMRESLFYGVIIFARCRSTNGVLRHKSSFSQSFLFVADGINFVVVGGALLTQGFPQRAGKGATGSQREAREAILGQQAYHTGQGRLFGLEVVGVQLGAAVLYKEHLPRLFCLTSCPNNTAYCFIGDVIIPCYFSEWFTFLNAMKNTMPLNNGYFPVWVCTWVPLLMRCIIGWVAVNKNIISAWEQLVKRDT